MLLMRTLQTCQNVLPAQVTAVFSSREPECLCSRSEICIPRAISQKGKEQLAHTKVGPSACQQSTCSGFCCCCSPSKGPRGSMAVNKRVTVLFGRSQDVGESFQRNETHLTVTTGQNVTLQTRIQLTNDDVSAAAVGDANVKRITWNPRGAELKPGVIVGFLNQGLNVYTDDKSVHAINGLPLVEGPKYHVLHVDLERDNAIDFEQYIPEYLLKHKSLLNWDSHKCQYDITFSEDMAEVTEYCTLQEDSELVVSTAGKPYIDNLEVGLFYIDSMDSEDINLTGLRCLWNDKGKLQNKCIKTSLFYKPAFIRTIDDNIPAPIDLETPIGLHPKILIDLSKINEKDVANNEENCQYFLFSQLPLEIFVDKFQSPSPLFVFGEHDLELPDYKLTEKSWGSETLFQLTPGELNEITLHSRYVKPLQESSHKKVSFDPVVFKACDKNPLDIIKNPFYFKSLGLETSFTDDTNFYILNSTTLTVPIPRPALKNFNQIQLITGLTILSSIIYLFYKIFNIKTKNIDAQKKKK